MHDPRRKKKEEEQQQSEERYRQLLEYSSDAILIHSDGVYVYANCEALLLFGVTGPKQLVGEPVTSTVHPDYREAVERLIQHVERTGISNSPEKQKMVRHDGISFDVEAVRTRITFQGKPAVQVILRDNTGRKRMERELADKTARLEIALTKMRRLEGTIPICLYCKKIKVVDNTWKQLENYISEHSEILFSHGICPECIERNLAIMADN